jgi:hypothetical protein
MRKATLEKHTEPEHSNLAPVENADREIQSSLESSRIAELVFKHFGAEIREALLEVQGSLAETNNKAREPLTDGKQVGKWQWHVHLGEIQLLVASGKHLFKMCYQILMNMKKSRHPSLGSKPSGPSAVSSEPLKKESLCPLEPANNEAKSTPLACAQRLLAGLAAKILKEEKVKVDAKQRTNSPD